MAQVPRSRIACYGLITIATLAVDLVTKHVAFDRLSGPFQSGGWLLDGPIKFEFHTSLNRGALWGMGQGGAPYFAVLSICAFLGINYWLFVKKAAESRWLTVALAFVSGGTLGNLYDRLGWHGVPWPGQNKPSLAVRDFLHFQLGSFDWAIFNFADVFLVTGAIMLVLQSMLTPNAPAAQTAVPSTATTRPAAAPATPRESPSSS